MFDYLRLRGHPWNHKRVRRIYLEMGLNLRIKPKKRLPARYPQPLVQPEAANRCWSLDFMSDSLANGRTIRTLNVIDDFNREALWIEIDTSLPAERVIRVLEMIVSWRGLPQQIRMDNGPELISRRMVEWADGKGVTLACIEPGKPAQNAYIDVSIAHIEKTSWTPICSIHFRRCVTSPSYGSKNTMGFAHMKLWEEFHRINSVLTSHESVYFRLVLKMGSLQLTPEFSRIFCAASLCEKGRLELIVVHFSLLLCNTNNDISPRFWNQFINNDLVYISQHYSLKLVKTKSS